MSAREGKLHKKFFRRKFACYFALLADREILPSLI